MVSWRRHKWHSPNRRVGQSRLLWRVAAFFFVGAFVVGAYMGSLKALPDRSEIVVPVYRHDIGETVWMEMEEYVKGVVAAEMPADFHLEALKAQAVAARTLALSLWQAQQPLAEHPEAIISTDYRVHQAWASPEEMRDRWGRLDFYWRWAKITRAVAETRGLALTYRGELIFPAYHSSSGGRTENSENYWTSPMPYLRSVDDPYVAGSRYEKTEARFTVAQVSEKTGAVAIPASEGPFVQVLSRYPSGRVEWVRVGELTISGRQLREKLGLRSNWFDVVHEGNRIRFDVFGHGHGVGMSQYGANGMAEAGFLFDQILSHYYTGVEIVSWYE